MTFGGVPAADMVRNLARLSSVLLPLTQSTLIWGCCFMNSAAFSWYCSVSGPALAGASQLIDAGPTLVDVPAEPPGAAPPWPHAARSAAEAAVVTDERSALLVAMVFA